MRFPLQAHARQWFLGALAICGLAATACQPTLMRPIATAPDARVSPGTLLVRTGDELLACGQLFHTGTPVILWLDPGGYDAYRVENRFDHEKKPTSLPATATASRPDDPPQSARYGTWRRHLPPETLDRLKREGWSLPELQQQVDLFVLHYDVCGTSKQCFKVLHDLRHLSVHFMLDIDGTIYQTLDLKERAWHAGHANDRSVGIEIANIGAYPIAPTTQPAGTSHSGITWPNELAKWYSVDAAGRPYVTLPAWMGDGGVRTKTFTAYPARYEPIVGEIHGRPLAQFDFTPQQYDALIKLTATLCRVLPGIKPAFPRGADGNVRMDLLSRDELARFSGILGHYHLTTDKIDPGPAFDWARLDQGLNSLRATAAR